MTLSSVDKSLRTLRNPSYAAEQQTDQLIQAGKSKEAEAMMKQVINYQNLEKKRERELYSMPTKAFVKSTFQGSVVSND